MMNHQDLVKLSQKLQIPTRAGGLCFGYAAALIPYMLLGNTEIFEQRLQQCSEVYKLLLENKLVAAIDQNLFADVYLFLSQISFHLNPGVWEKTSHTEGIFLQDVLISMPLLHNQDLQNEGGLAGITNISGIYHISDSSQANELYLLFNSLKQKIEQENCQKNFSMLLSNHDHTFHLGFDAQKEQWILADANPEKESSETKILAFTLNEMKHLTHSVTTALQDENSNQCPYIAIAFQIYSTQNDRRAVTHLINSWETSQEFQNIHQVTGEKAQQVDCNNFTWLAHAINLHQCDTVKSLLTKGSSVEHIPFSSLEIPILRNNISLTASILDFSPFYQYCNKDDLTLLDLAVRSGKHEIVDLFLTHGANIDELSNGWTLEQVAYLSHDSDQMLQILQKHRLLKQEKFLEGIVNALGSKTLEVETYTLFFQQPDQHALIQQIKKNKNGHSLINQYFNWLQEQWKLSDSSETDYLIAMILIFQCRLESPLATFSIHNNQIILSALNKLTLLLKGAEDIWLKEGEISALRTSIFGEILNQLIDELPIEAENDPIPDINEEGKRLGRVDNS